MTTDGRTGGDAPGDGSGDALGHAFSTELQGVLPRLQVWARLRLRDRVDIDADDFVQEVCVRAWSLHGKRDPAAPFAAWLFRIAKFVLLEISRSLRRSRALGVGRGVEGADPTLGGVADALTTLSKRVARRIDAEAFVASLPELEVTDEQVLLLCGLEGVGPSEAAQRLGLSKDMVTKRWQRLREKLRFGVLDSPSC